MSKNAPSKNVKMIIVGKYHINIYQVKRLYQTLQFFYALLDERNKALKNCR